MARFGTGINASLGAINYTPYMQGSMAGSQAIAQGIASIGQAAGGAIRDYKQKKEEEKKISNTISFLEKAYNNDKEGFSFLADDKGNFDKAASEAAVRAVGSDGIMTYANMSSAKAEKRDQKKIAAQVAELNQARKSGLFDVVAGSADPRALQIFNDQEMEREAKTRQGELVSSQVIKNLSDAGEAARSEAAKLRQNQQANGLVNIANASSSFEDFMKSIQESGLPSEKASEVWKSVSEAKASSSDPTKVKSSVMTVDLPGGASESIIVVSVPGKPPQILPATSGRLTATAKDTELKKTILKQAEDAYNSGNSGEAVRLLRASGFKNSIGGIVTVGDLQSLFPKSSGYTVEVE
jgi:hypothetical protein